MRRLLKITMIVVSVIVVLILGVACWYLSQAAPIGVGYVAKYLCSSTFISERDPETVFKEDIKPVNPLANVMTWNINYQEKSVTASSLFFFKAKAVFRDGCGSTLVQKDSEEQLARQTFFKYTDDDSKLILSEETPWPNGNGDPVEPEKIGIDKALLDAAMDDAFKEPAQHNPRKTRAVVIAYDGHLIAERYAPGFNKDMPLLGWSMTKSITSALVGILVHKGMLDIYQPAAVEEWQEKDDPRNVITVDQLLRMSSGLQFGEVYDPLYDATDMLYGAKDFAAFAASKELEVEPDSKWHYSSGTANIVARIVRHNAEQLYDNYYDFGRKNLFDKIGMFSVVLEPDISGTFVGSSYGFATPRDWARFGQLYLNDGVWNGERILPEGWVKYTSTPTAHAPKGEYGAMFWLNAGAPDNPQDRLWPDAPTDAFAALGYQEQKVIIIPSRKAVLVRFGATSDRPSWDTNEFIANVLAALPEVQ